VSELSYKKIKKQINKDSKACMHEMCRKKNKPRGCMEVSQAEGPESNVWHVDLQSLPMG
jgi:hypothetical protein